MEDSLDNTEGKYLFIKPKRSRVFSISIALIATIGLVIIFFTTKFFIESSYSTIKLTYTPLSATALIDDKVYAAGTIRISPGKHELKVQKYGFETQNLEFEAPSGQTVPIDIVLVPNEKFTENWYEQNQNDSTIIEGISSRESDQQRTQMFEEYPAFKRLPVRHDHFTIYQATCDGSFYCIMIDARQKYRDEAIQYFKKNIEEDIGRYYITFKDYTNPFKGEG